MMDIDFGSAFKAIFILGLGAGLALMGVIWLFVHYL